MSSVRPPYRGRPSMNPRGIIRSALPSKCAEVSMSRFILFAMVACVSAAQTPSDPLQYTVFLGLETSISSVAVDDAGSAYITGSTRAPLPVTAGALQTQYAQPTCSQGPPFGGAPAPSIPCQVAFAGKLNA